MLRLVTDGGGRPEIDFDDRSEAGFLRVAAYLETQLGAESTARVDGPGQAYWDYRLDGVPLTLHHDDMAGNVLFPADDSGHATIERLFPVLAGAGLYPPE